MYSNYDKIKNAIKYFITGQFFISLYGKWLLNSLDKPRRPFKYYFIRADKNISNKEYFKAKHDREMAEIFADINEIMPPLTYTEQQSNELADLQITINSFVNEMFARFISGDASVDNDWDSYIDQLNGMNLDRYVQLQQEAYDSKWSGR